MNELAHGAEEEVCVGCEVKPVHNHHMYTHMYVHIHLSRGEHMSVTLPWWADTQYRGSLYPKEHSLMGVLSHCISCLEERVQHLLHVMQGLLSVRDAQTSWSGSLMGKRKQNLNLKNRAVH